LQKRREEIRSPRAHAGRKRKLMHILDKTTRGERSRAETVYLLKPKTRKRGGSGNGKTQRCLERGVAKGKGSGVKNAPGVRKAALSPFGQRTSKVEKE